VKGLRIVEIGLLSMSLAALLTGCAAVAKSDTPPSQIMQEGDVSYNIDPYQSFNRKMFSFNNQVNRYVIKPVSDTYNKVLPYPVRKGIANVFINVGSVSVITNDMLQNNWQYAWQDTARFVLNSTLGLLGLFDVASDVGLPARTQSFGLTLAKWGVTYSPYLVLPVLGPSTVRGTVAMAPEYFMTPITYINPPAARNSVEGLYFVQIATGLLPKQQLIGSMALDPYIALRNAYLQNSDYLVQQIQTEAPSTDEGY
jgi:phospholipid-binding lipoprotein MlaA